MGQVDKVLKAMKWGAKHNFTIFYHFIINYLYLSDVHQIIEGDGVDGQNKFILL
jgi:hypothetical protein